MLSTHRGPFLLLLFALLAVFPVSWVSAAQVLPPEGVLPAGRMQQATATSTAVNELPAAEEQARIVSPEGGEALQGVVSVKGVSDVPGFRSAEVSFAYQNNPTGTWFLLGNSATPVKDGALASWDTTGIADGVYRLRLQVFLADGHTQESEITGLRVRNYSPVETSTPGPKPGAGSGMAQPVALASSSTPTITPTFPDFQVTPRAVTPLPPNPIQVTGVDLRSSAALGVAVVAGILAAFGVYLGIRTITKK